MTLQTEINNLEVDFGKWLFDVASVLDFLKSICFRVPVIYRVHLVTTNRPRLDLN